jgi:hypothetical protein
LTARQDLSASFIGTRRMINQGLMQEVIAIFYRRPLNVCLRLSPGGKHLCRLAFPLPENAFFGCAPYKVLIARA